MIPLLALLGFAPKVGTTANKKTDGNAFVFVGVETVVSFCSLGYLKCFLKRK